MPPLFAAINEYDNFPNKGKWQDMFDRLLEDGDANREWGPDFHPRD